ncbi:hypothetical protein [Paenibacillus sp. FSL R10-2734]|uniref:hypothetical protein n=1 Tax=Paenibacillus sp. FSL R10-2734 TaxID=2954691 RepID=UPI0030DD8AE5
MNQENKYRYSFGIDDRVKKLLVAIENYKVQQNEFQTDKVHQAFQVLVKFSQKHDQHLDTDAKSKLIEAEKIYNQFLSRIGEPTNKSLSSPRKMKSIRHFGKYIIGVLIIAFVGISLIVDYLNNRDKPGQVHTLMVNQVQEVEATYVYNDTEQYIIQNGEAIVKEIDMLTFKVKNEEVSVEEGLARIRLEMNREGINNSRADFMQWYNLILTDYFNAINSLSFGNDLEEFNESINSAKSDLNEFLYNLEN